MCKIGYIRMQIEKGADDFLDMLTDIERPPTRREALMLPEAIKNAVCLTDDDGKTAVDRLLDKFKGNDPPSEAFEMLWPVWSDKYFRLVKWNVWPLKDGTVIHGSARIERWVGGDKWTHIAEISIDDYVALREEGPDAVKRGCEEGLERMRLDTLPRLEADDELCFSRDDDDAEPRPSTDNPEAVVCGHGRFWRDYEGERYVDICFPRGYYRTY